MPTLEPKKLALLRIWQILLKHSDYDHPLTQEDRVDFFGIMIISSLVYAKRDRTNFCIHL